MKSNDRTTDITAPGNRIDFAAVFNAMPTTCAIISVPDYRIVAATDSFCRAVYRDRGKVIGFPLTDVLPYSPSMPQIEASSILLDAFDKVRQTKKPVGLGVIRYDIIHPDNTGGITEEHWWRISETPVLDERGNIVYIIHVAEEVSQVLDALEELEVAAKHRADSF